jgi:ribose transport system substrate-binding protein
MRSPTLIRKARNLALCMFLVLIVCVLSLNCRYAQSSPASNNIWDGPVSGPVKHSGKKITFLAQDLRNGGISAAFRHFNVAASMLGWQVRLTDGIGDRKTIRTQFEDALRAHPDAIVLGGFQVDPDFSDLSVRAKQLNIVLIGWHAAAEPGPTTEMFANIATPSVDVAKMAADYVVQNSQGNVGVVIINDSRFSVANAKTRHMQEVIEKCKRCKVLSIEDIPISEAGNQIPIAVPRLNQAYGKAWTHTLAINDVYFDEMNFPLAAIERSDIQNISAGDGSNKALSRIKSGKSQQVATIAEPLGAQGWQLADELNRAFAGQSPSGYVSKPILVTTQLLKQLNGADIDSNLPYQSAYSAIWNAKPVTK